MSETPSVELCELARSYGVHLDYVDMSGQTKAASTRSLLSVLQALDAELSGEGDAARVLRERKRSLWRRRVEPVIVAWEDTPTFVEVRVPTALGNSKLVVQFWSQLGEAVEWTIPASQAGPMNLFDVEGEWFVTRRLPLPEKLPRGYNRLRIAFDDGHAAMAMIIAAPRKAYEGPGGSGKRTWGIFCPLYALHRGSSWGAGDLSDLEALIDWTADQGGGLVATLPMLASNFDGTTPIISPYSPTSRLFWNEFYLDLSRIPEMARSEAARALLESSETARELEALQASDRVDYGRQMRLKRAVLEQLAATFFDGENDQVRTFHDYLVKNPEVTSYAFFQAAGERHGRDWRAWHESLDQYREGADIDVGAYHYHLYAQWQTDRQLRSLAEKARDKGMAWYLDFPIGVDHSSFDVWKNRQVFATGASVGCPPDPVFTKGQNWGFAPLHPDRHRETGYAYLIASIRNHLKYANALRIDHVMGLHRLFWIARGAEAKDGAFVSAPAEEIYAILSLESHRHAAWLVGEDLGTVPPEVDGAMKRHNVRGMYVIQYEVRPDTAGPLREVPEATVASLNTHDMPTLAAFWSGIDLDDRKDLGLLSEEGLEAEKQVRADQRQALVMFLRAEGMLTSDASETRAVLQALWNWLAASPSSVLLLNIEDLWLETEPQNTPNTYFERPNWQRKLRHAFEQFSHEPAFLDLIKQVDEFRSKPVKESSSK